MNVKLDFQIMTRLFSSVCLVMFLSPGLARATDATWINNGTIVIAPNIDATNVINNGTFNISTIQPFDTSNTQNFTNSGSLNGAVGFRFDNAPRNSSGQLIGQRKPARNFVNRTGGSVNAAEGFTITGGVDGGGGGSIIAGATGSYLLVQATNIINQGTLAVGADGLMQLVGTNVNLSRSQLGVNSIVPRGSFNARTNFTPDTAITDVYWGQTNDTFNISQLTRDVVVPIPTLTNVIFQTNLLVSTPLHGVSSGGPAFDASFNFTIAYGDFYTNVVTIFTNNAFITVTNIGDRYTNFVSAFTNVAGGANFSLTNASGAVSNVFLPTNVVYQAVFVKVASTNAGVNIRFSPSPQPTNFYYNVGVQISTRQTNIFTQTNDLVSLYFSDTLAGGTAPNTTNRGTLLNNRDGTRRPANYVLSRFPVPEYSGGQPGNLVYTNDLFYAPNLFSRFSYGLYSGYAALIDNLVSRPPAIPSGDYTNNPGRVEIQADTLDMNRARIRTEGLLSIKARHLINSSNAVVDSENIALNLGSTNGTLQVQNLMNDTVDRITGTVRAFSFIWTNTFSQVLTNYDTATNPAVLVLITNTVNVNYHALILDAQFLQRQLPVIVHEFRAKATNVIVNDNATLSRTLLVQSDSLTLNGALTLSGSLQNWNTTLVPTLKYFTNTGSLSIPNEAHFGDEGPTPYSAFVNLGTIQAYGQNIRSLYAQFSGLNSASASFNLLTSNGLIDGGQIYAGSGISLAGSSIRLTNQAVVVSGQWLVLDVTNSLSDDLAYNEIDVRDGFFMFTKPAFGDLLGTEVYSFAPNYAQVNHLWAGRNDGVSNTGYTNNVALGSLTLIPEGFDPLFVFSGADANNGLYVDALDLSQLTDYASQLQIDPNLTIYYAAAYLSPSVTLPGGQSPEEFLDGQFGGQLRWVKTYAGLFSSTAVPINGNQVITVNSALRNSTTLDSDADGEVNALDDTPFGGVNITSIQRNASPAGYKLTWNAAPNTLYRVEVSTNLISPVWTPQFTTTSTNSIVAPWTVLDTNAAPAGVTRYYRVTYSPSN
jgi:hypothetical protein